MIDNLLILPLNEVEPTLTPERLFFITFWVLTLPMFVATVGVFLLRRIDLNIKLPDQVKLMLPLFYAGLVWGMAFSLPDTVIVVAEFIANWVYEDAVYFVDTYIVISILSVPSILGFLQAYLGYPDRVRLYMVVFVVVLVASWALSSIPFLGQARGIGYFGSFVLFIGILIMVVSPLAYFVLLAYIYRESSDSDSFLDSVLIPWLLITVIYSPLVLFSYLLLIS